MIPVKRTAGTEAVLVGVAADESPRLWSKDLEFEPGSINSSPFWFATIPASEPLSMVDAIFQQVVERYGEHGDD